MTMCGGPHRRGWYPIGKLPAQRGLKKHQFFWNPGTQKTEVYPRGGPPVSVGGGPPVGRGGSPGSVGGGTPEIVNSTKLTNLANLANLANLVKIGVSGGVPPETVEIGEFPKFRVSGGSRKKRGSENRVFLNTHEKKGSGGGQKSQKNAVFDGTNLSTF